MRYLQEYFKLLLLNNDVSQRKSLIGNDYFKLPALD